ncbi:uncharacterized protein LOC112507185 [Cynara cardunculus var. scolymus]|uniref:uncharacterized protein LOC112507185 n=1 Tax=Cynara cardunculus var. scolymus TaxID=59895 RepID=UPI000D6252CE|nr:uncharacterized protein LOC112507185 [Cynara cardunculus var. scolymus]
MTENNRDSKMAVETNTALKEALCAQQRLLQKLYNELDVEREASATAASEALAMILRLQGEKASIKMEAEQYKRLAEEKMYHAEESMEVFEDFIRQKEMEIASLDYQVQAYRYKLSCLGIEDIGAKEIKYPENLLQLNETSVGESNPEGLLRRNSAPPKLLKLAYVKRNRSMSPDSDMIPKIVEESGQEEGSHQNLDSEKQMDGSLSVDINSYWDQIRKLDKIVEEMAGEQFLSLRDRSSRSSSVFSQLNELDQAQILKKSADDEMLSDTCSLSVHDVFEVPETNGNLASHEQVKDNGISILKNEKEVGKLVTFPEEAMKSCNNAETGLCEKGLLLKHKDKQAFFPRDGINISCHMAVDLPAMDVADAQGSSEQVNTTEITEGEREDVRSQEQVSTTGREEVMKMLYEINEKLDSIQSEIRSKNTKTKESSPKYDLPMLQLTEAMLHFWL